MKNILFICTHNSGRSQMAEGYLRHKAGDRFEVFSAGTNPHPVNPLAVKVMSEIGIDISRHEPTDLAEYLGKVQFESPGNALVRSDFGQHLAFG